MSELFDRCIAHRVIWTCARPFLCALSIIAREIDERGRVMLMIGWAKGIKTMPNQRRFDLEVAVLDRIATQVFALQEKLESDPRDQDALREVERLRPRLERLDRLYPFVGLPHLPQ